MTDIAILTPDPADQSYRDLWQKVLARLQDALSSQGIVAVPTPWTAHVDAADGLRRFARVLPLLVWGYHCDHARWLRACATWRQAGIPMSNPADVLAWNSDKRYLLELAARGVAVPPTVLMSEVTGAQLRRVFAETGADELIVKPTVSGGAWRTRRVHRDAALDEVPAGDAHGGDMLVQPYLPTIASEGETSLLFFGGTLSHVVNKRPPAGEFRVQEQFGGVYTSLPAPPAGALALAERTLAAIDAPLLYARIDTVPDAEGNWLLMEAELIEPDFYLGADPRRGEGFAAALQGLL
ncbi:ATP-grasp domain-containing protein [Luteimonas terricola]|uniref:ATP-grasp domain-containing protein n=1 Tax=Luteimonas terricola TaxID=645597 RepID=A0ABQ2EFP5_9GAMM|nr:transporter [Luteimonas terricola]GGK10710.1 ATP-grasp domain-containing protein [Luteimonas terricola]